MGVGVGVGKVKQQVKTNLFCLCFSLSLMHILSLSRTDKMGITEDPTTHRVHRLFSRGPQVGPFKLTLSILSHLSQAHSFQT